jgi:hypothetical protein
MTPIKPYGAFFDIDADGYIVNGTHRDLILPPWSEAVDVIQARYLAEYTDHIHSVYLRGSVPRGLAIEGVSDIDSYAILKPGSERMKDYDREIAIESELSKQFSLLNGIEFFVLPYSKVERVDSAQRFVIKVGSLCLWGEDLGKGFPGYKPGKQIAFFAENYAEQFAEFREKYATVQDADELKSYCTWFMKRTVRSGFDLVMEQAGKYTCDLYPSYQAFSKIYPDREAEMRQALEWAINPTSDVDHFNLFLNTFCVWLRDKIENYLK